MKPLICPVGLMAVQAGKDIIRIRGINIGGLEGAFFIPDLYVPCIYSISMGCTVYVRVVTVAVIPHYGLHRCISSIRVNLFILVAIHAECHVIGQIGAVGRTRIA